jgi:glycerol-3-phosphate dehydrogenase
VVLFSEIDGRLFFVIPLRGFAWIGTTDTDYDADPGEVAATPEDVEYLMRSTGAYVPSLAGSEVYWTNAGVRALVMRPGSESSISRAHRIDVSDGLVSVLGGKITGYRAIAEDATDAAARCLGVKQKCTTASKPLPGTRAPREEQCVHLADYMLRRTSLGFTPDQGRSVLEETAAMLAGELGWSAERRRAEIEDYLAGIAGTHPLLHCRNDGHEAHRNRR